MCDRVAMLPQQTSRETLRAQKNAARDGTPEHKEQARNLAFKKRHRVGPHR